MREKGIGAPLTPTFTKNSRPLRQNHYTSSTTALYIFTVGISQGMRHSGGSIDQNICDRRQQFIATTTFKLQVRGPITAKGRTIAGRKSDENRNPPGKSITTWVSFGTPLPTTGPNIGYSKTQTKLGSNRHPLTGPHVDSCSKRTSATPFLHSIDCWCLCLDIAVEKLILSPSH